MSRAIDDVPRLAFARAILFIDEISILAQTRGGNGARPRTAACSRRCSPRSTASPTGASRARGCQWPSQSPHLWP